MSRCCDRLEQHDQAPSQRLLLPETVELSARDAQFPARAIAGADAAGRRLERIRRAHVPAGRPAAVCEGRRRRAGSCSNWWTNSKPPGRKSTPLRLGEHTVAKTVCRHAVKANDPLAGRELENLVEDLRHCAMPYTCPHGRPDAHRDELPRAGEEVRPDAVSASKLHRLQSCAGQHGRIPRTAPSELV